MNEYRCTRNVFYTHDCIGRNNTTARQGYYITANSAEEAWQKMAIRFPEEAKDGFTVEEWKSFNVKVVEVNPEDYYTQN